MTIMMNPHPERVLAMFSSALYRITKASQKPSGIQIAMTTHREAKQLCQVPQLPRQVAGIQTQTFKLMATRIYRLSGRKHSAGKAVLVADPSPMGWDSAQG